MFKKKQFSLTDEQYNTIKNWAETHECRLRKKERASSSCIGGEISVTFTPTSIGTYVAAHCSCGKELDLNNL